MGGALARAAVKGAQGARVLLANRTPAKAQALADQLGCQATDNQTVAAQCQLIFLGVKPQMMEGLLKSIAPVLAGRKDRFVLASMAAGLTARRIQELAGADYPVIRLMPNTPAEVGAGVIQFCGVDVEPGELKDFQTLLAEALADGAVACGLPRDKARRYAAQTMEGTAKLMRQTGAHPGAVKDAVCSPGGSTIQGVRVLEANGFRAAAIDAVIAAFEKTQALGKG